ncbi:MAG TPA: Na+/H+ antiporter subunit D [Planctomycetaceae bacterium]|nr:Na+/H+ antiporter subunit D [Planctomycetaceae bacterium]
MNTLLILPVIVPLATAALMLLSHRRGATQQVIALFSTALQLIVAALLFHAVHTRGIQVTQFGGWPARYGITFVADLLSALMVLLSGTIAMATVVYSLANIDRQRRAFGFYPLMQVLLMGANGAFLTGDLFNLYVWFEVLLIASFVLLVLGNERPQMEGALKYVTLNLISSMLFLTAIGILYGSVGALNMADIAMKLSRLPVSMTGALAMLFLVAFGIKAAVFPLFFWLPDSYHTPPVTVIALFAGLLTKVGIYSMIRIFSLFFPLNASPDQTLILVMAGLTMVIGVLGAVAQTEVRRILAFHSVSQMGYIMMGFGLFTAASLGGAIFFLLHHSVVKSNLFLISGVIQRRRGTTRLSQLGDLIRTEPWLAGLFLVTALSLAGMPPLTGFWAKLALVQAGLEIGSSSSFAIVGVSLAVSILTLISMIKIWNEAFWKPRPDDALPASVPSRTATFLMYAPIVLLTALTVLFGLAPEPLLVVVRDAAEQLLHRPHYVKAVLGMEFDESVTD